MNSSKKKILFVTNYLITGGPRLTHQAALLLKNRGASVDIAYVPDGFTNQCFLKNVPPLYEGSVPVVDKLGHEPYDLIIVPETCIGYVTLLAKYAHRIFIWWQSVDNAPVHPFYSYSRPSSPHLLLHYLKHIRSYFYFQAVPNLYHLCQSYYSYSFLVQSRIDPSQIFMLSDYIDDEFFSHPKPLSQSRRSICLMPSKAQWLFSLYPCLSDKLNHYYGKSIIFLRGMTTNEIIMSLDQSCLYLDFSRHPGKDRPPREAILRNCVVISTYTGSAMNNLDFLLPSVYKLRLTPQFLPNLFKLVDSVISNPLPHHSLQQHERHRITLEKRVFEDQLYIF